MSAPEKPWYTPAIVAFLEDDVPRVVGISPAALSRDVKTLESRVTMEGESFLTKTLPSFGKAFDFALQERSPLAVSGFRKRSRRSALPAFLQALLRRVFKDDGHVLSTPCIKTITVVRQLCFWCKKVEKGFTDESLQRAVSDFVSTDEALPADRFVCDRRLLVLARRVITKVFRNFPGLSGMSPRHGPGAVAWGKKHPKQRLGICYEDLEKVFRPIPWFRSLRDASENPQGILRRPKCKFGVSKLAFVEKDSSGPRLIGLEPPEYMWVQQALKACLYNHIERHPFTKGRVNFSDQSVNRKLALDWQRYDTLDMSSASDRNSLLLVRTLFAKTKVLRYLEASRTPGIVLPSGELLVYKKFAPMGSAVCFPIEAIVFYALAVASLVIQGYPLLLALKNTFVYGDDLIVPHGYFEGLSRHFESVGLKFSDAKCCLSGKFRESCGLDAFDGIDVTPLRLRRPHMNRGPIDLISLVEHHNALMLKGYWFASDTLRKIALKRFQLLASWRLPYVDRLDYPVTAWYSFHKSTIRVKYKDSQSYVTGIVFRPLMVRTQDADDRYFLRISLSTGGPVGEFKKIAPGQRVRFVTEQRNGIVCKKKMSYLPRYDGGAEAP